MTQEKTNAAPDVRLVFIQNPLLTKAMVEAMQRDADLLTAVSKCLQAQHGVELGDPFMVSGLMVGLPVTADGEPSRIVPVSLVPPVKGGFR